MITEVQLIHAAKLLLIHRCIILRAEAAEEDGQVREAAAQSVDVFIDAGTHDDRRSALSRTCEFRRQDVGDQNSYEVTIATPPLTPRRPERFGAASCRGSLRC